MAEVSVVTPNTSEESAVTTILSTNSNWTAAATGLYVDLSNYRDNEIGLAIRMADAASSSAGTATLTVYDGAASTAGGYYRTGLGNLTVSVTLPACTAPISNPAVSLIPLQDSARFKDQDGYVYFDLATSNSTATDIAAVQIPNVAP